VRKLSKEKKTEIFSWFVVIATVAAAVSWAEIRETADYWRSCKQAVPAGFLPDRARIIESLKSVAEHSKDLSNWSVGMIAGAIATIVGTSYLRPAKLSMRLAYLLFPLSWTLLICSTLAGREVKGSYLASTIVADRFLYDSVACANAALARQLDFLTWGTAVLGVWLVIFLRWWVFDPEEKAK